jgi:hypothetical protein
MRRLRYRLRTLLIIVAVVGALLGGSIESARRGRRAESYRGLARSYAVKAADYANTAAVADRTAKGWWRVVAVCRQEARQAARDPVIANAFLQESGWRDRGRAAIFEALRNSESAKHNHALAAWYARESSRYARAANRPWLHVEPSDPPME